LRKQSKFRLAEIVLEKRGPQGGAKIFRRSADTVDGVVFFSQSIEKTSTNSRSNVALPDLRRL